MIPAESTLPLGWDWGLLVKIGLMLSGNEILKPYRGPETRMAVAFTSLGRGSSFPDKLDRPVSGRGRHLSVHIWAKPRFSAQGLG